MPVWDAIARDDPEKVITLEIVDKETVNYIQHEKMVCSLSLKDEESLINLFNFDRILIDISGLPHNVWAPLLQVCIRNKINVRVLYAEPKSYKPHPAPSSSTLFDLSSSFGGLAPLPGFAKLVGPDDTAKCFFIALLGFEGSRPERLFMQIDPAPKVIPVVGVPGFQYEYPAYTVACNRSLFRGYASSSDIRLARASCSFEVYGILSDIHDEYPDYYMYLAPVGTKPHSLGAIWFAIDNPEFTEIMFDYPERKKGRTEGLGIVHIYDLSST